jgi:Na+-translocating ferredoxin:NAD+ oxidoreductase RNF subunit RnfB
MAFTAPTYAIGYDQTEQNANAVLIAAAINKCVAAAQKNQEAIAALLNTHQSTDLFTAAAQAANSAKATRDLLP